MVNLERFTHKIYILDKILVDYDPELKVHNLTINFKIPVVFRDVDEGREPTRVIVTPPKSGRKKKNQNEPFRDYSTVTLFTKFRGWSTLQPRKTAM